MLLLDKSPRIDGYLQLKKPFVLPADVLMHVKNRRDSFILRTEVFRDLRYGRIEGLAKLIAQKYHMPISLSVVTGLHTLLRYGSWNLEIAKYSLMSVLHDNVEFPDFVLPEKTKEIVEEYILPHKDFKESIENLQAVFVGLIGQIDYEFIKKHPYRPERGPLSNAEKYTPLGNLLFIYHYVWSIVDTTEFEDRMNALAASEKNTDEFDDMILLRCGGRIALFNNNSNKTWTFHDFDYRNQREHKKTGHSYANIDEMTFFDVDGDDFIMHDDIIPLVKYYDDKGKTHNPEELMVDNMYFMEVTYQIKKDAKIGERTISFKPTVGCVFQKNDVKLVDGKATTQIKITGNLYKFKIADKNKQLPFRFFYNTKKLNADNLPWLK